MSVASRFDNFLSNIKLTKAQADDAYIKYNGICRKLHDYFYPGITYSGSTKLLCGSYSKDTNIRPARDVDVIFKMPWSEFSNSTLLNNVQSTLLQKIKNILKDKYSDTDMRGDGQVVVVNFSGAHFVEVVPAFEFDSGKFDIPDTSDGGKWKLADPRAEIKNINDSDIRSKGNTRNLIRMLKKWQEICDVPIKSVVLELRAINFFNSYTYYDKSSFWYDWMVRDYFSELLRHVNNTCTMPGLNEKISYGDEWKSKAESALARATKACEYEKNSDEINATTEWKKIFGDDFTY